jgi:hypothetical protein
MESIDIKEVNSTVELLQRLSIRPHKGCILCPLFRLCRCEDCKNFNSLIRQEKISTDWLARLITAYRHEFTWGDHNSKRHHAMQQLRTFKHVNDNKDKQHLRNFIGGQASISKIFCCDECFTHLYGRSTSWRKQLAHKADATVCFNGQKEPKRKFVDLNDLRMIVGNELDKDVNLLPERIVGLSHLPHN